MLEPGSVALSLAGSDRGRRVAVLGRDADGFCRVADGKRHRLSAPKRKNPKHLRETSAPLRPEQYRTDRQLRRALRELSSDR